MTDAEPKGFALRTTNRKQGLPIQVILDRSVETFRRYIWALLLMQVAYLTSCAPRELCSPPCRLFISDSNGKNSSPPPWIDRKQRPDFSTISVVSFHDIPKYRAVQMAREDAIWRLGQRLALMWSSAVERVAFERNYLPPRRMIHLEEMLDRAKSDLSYRLTTGETISANVWIDEASKCVYVLAVADEEVLIKTASYALEDVAQMMELGEVTIQEFNALVIGRTIGERHSLEIVDSAIQDGTPFDGVSYVGLTAVLLADCPTKSPVIIKAFDKQNGDYYKQKEVDVALVSGVELELSFDIEHPGANVKSLAVQFKTHCLVPRGQPIVGRVIYYLSTYLFNSEQ